MSIWFNRSRLYQGWIFVANHDDVCLSRKLCDWQSICCTISRQKRGVRIMNLLALRSTILLVLAEQEQLFVLWILTVTPPSISSRGAKYDTIALLLLLFHISISIQAECSQGRSFPLTLRLIFSGSGKVLSMWGKQWSG